MHSPAGSPLRNGSLFTLVLMLLMPAASSSLALTSNGNDFALYYTEAASAADKQALLDDASGRPHLFRYLRVVTMEEKMENGRTAVDIVTEEPASGMRVSFLLTRSISQQKLKDPPETKPGDGIALTGKVRDVDAASNTLLIDSVIIRHKDKITPVVGKENLQDVKTDAIVYSYTAGPRPVNVSYRDRDLVQHKNRILAQGGPKAWTEFLEQELAKRKRERAAERAR